MKRYSKGKSYGALRLSAKRKRPGPKKGCLKKRKMESLICGTNTIQDVTINEYQAKGRRIVEIGYFLEQLTNLSNHGPLGCTFSDMLLVGEIKKGLNCGLKFSCRMCQFQKTVWTNSLEHANMLDINKAAVLGITEIGCGFSNLAEVTSHLNIPPMSDKTFLKEQSLLSNAWEQAATQEMEAAVAEEKRLAVAAGDVDAEGYPRITVVADGSWAKRSYRCNYSSLSGAAAIVGYRTKKVLHLGVRNKYCSYCSLKEKKGETTENHRCFKNWTGSSSSMEADIVVEGFLQSFPLHKIYYDKLIADGDSNVYLKVLESRPYLNITVKKIECRNHLLRNLFNKLKEIVKDSKSGYHISHRKLLGNSLLRIRGAIDKASIYWRNSRVSQEEKVSNLRQNIGNTLYHIFGEHSNCQEYFCSKGNSEKNLVPELKTDRIFYRMKESMSSIEDNAESILYGANNNPVEHFNARICKKVGGKRINYCLRGSYLSRCNSAVISHNSDFPMTTIHRAITESSPGFFTKLSDKRKQNARGRLQNKPRRKKLFKTADTDTKAYGVLSQRPDLSPGTISTKEELFLRSLSLSAEERESLLNSTRDQARSGIWVEERRKRLTASNFGRVCKMLPATGCGRFVKTLLYGNFENAATKYGQANEETAIKLAEQKLSVKIRKCGLFIDEDFPFLGASPDGVIDSEDALVEVKCPHTAREKSPYQYLRESKSKFLIPDQENDEIVGMNKTHDHYFQVQGQLHIAKKSFCWFILYSPKGLILRKISKDEDFWNNKMKNQLVKFYRNCILPELLDPRHPRSMPIREPEYILAEQEKKRCKRKN